MRKKSEGQKTHTRASKILLVGAFPPPVHGMALINNRMYECLANKTIAQKIDIAPPSGAAWLKSTRRFMSVLKGAYSAMNSRTTWDVLYIGLSGGWGQFYEMVFVALARVLRKDIYLHHHSYAYINKTKIPFWLISRIAGRSCTHICLSDGMCLKLAARYTKIKMTVTLSNVAFISPPKKLTRPQREKLKIGFLSNISFEKGIKIFIETLDLMRSEGIEFEAFIAGPIVSNKVQKLIDENTQSGGDTSYLGPVYGNQKEKFLNGIDILLFPTIYENEAEPLTIYECYSYGVPVISLSRGSIPEMMREYPALCISMPSNFPEESKVLIKHWVESPKKFDAVSTQVITTFFSQRQKARENLQVISSDMIRVRAR